MKHPRLSTLTLALLAGVAAFAVVTTFGTARAQGTTPDPVSWVLADPMAFLRWLAGSPVNLGLILFGLVATAKHDAELGNPPIKWNPWIWRGVAAGAAVVLSVMLHLVTGLAVLGAVGWWGVVLYALVAATLAVIGKDGFQLLVNSVVRGFTKAGAALPLSKSDEGELAAEAELAQRAQAEADEAARLAELARQVDTALPPVPDATDTPPQGNLAYAPGAALGFANLGDMGGILGSVLGGGFAETLIKGALSAFGLPVDAGTVLAVAVKVGPDVLRSVTHQASEASLAVINNVVIDLAIEHGLIKRQA